MTFRTHMTELTDLVVRAMNDCSDDVEAAIRVIANAIAAGNKILVCGNGGSAADAQHFAAEFVGRYMHERSALPAIGLSADISIVTAVGNDYGFPFIFARQIEALGYIGDVLVVISTSGLSPNLIEAVKTAREREMCVITLTGRNANPWLVYADVWCHIDSVHTAHIQEIQIAMLHAICKGVEERLEAP